MNIVFEDAHVVVCEKEAGIASERSPDGNDMVTLLLTGGRKEIFPVHRLDTATTGLMVYAKTKRAAAFLSKEIAEDRFSKEYAALIHGVPAEPEGTWEDLLYRDKQKNKSYVVKRERKGVKTAKLSYAVRSTKTTDKGVFSLVRVKLYTGRTHQIRVQFASRRLPLAGDGKYGANDNIKKLGLKCVKLAFVHPETGEPLTFEISDDMGHVL